MHLSLAHCFHLAVVDTDYVEQDLRSFSNASSTPVYERWLRNMAYTFAFFV